MTGAGMDEVLSEKRWNFVFGFLLSESGYRYAMRDRGDRFADLLDNRSSLRFHSVCRAGDAQGRYGLAIGVENRCCNAERNGFHLLIVNTIAPLSHLLQRVLKAFH